MIGRLLARWLPARAAQPLAESPATVSPRYVALHYPAIDGWFLNDSGESLSLLSRNKVIIAHHPLNAGNAP